MQSSCLRHAMEPQWGGDRNYRLYQSSNTKTPSSHKEVKKAFCY